MTELIQKILILISDIIKNIIPALVIAIKETGQIMIKILGFFVTAIKWLINRI
ncbi:MAG: hypothetical protein QMD86_00640 [Patescibacteria group bacterium]|nr:hypothetical protein [Patescibacteria group bacterium]